MQIYPVGKELRKKPDSNLIFKIISGHAPMLKLTFIIKFPLHQYFNMTKRLTPVAASHPEISPLIPGLTLLYRLFL